MLLKKMKRIVEDKGISALKIKVLNRLKYKKASVAYALTNHLTTVEAKKQYERKYKTPIMISICVPVYNVDKEFFRQMLDSVLKQTYSNWQLCLADGSTAKYDYIEPMVKACNDKRIKYKRLIANRGIVGNSNEAVAMADGEYVALLDNDDVLAINALFELRRAIDSGADFIYSDEASFSKNINIPDITHFKSDFSIFNLRGNNYICHLSAFKKELFEKAGGFRMGYDGSQDHDLILRLCENASNIVHIPKVLYNWRVHSGSVASDISAKPYCIVTGVRAINSHLKRCGVAGECKAISSNTSVYRVIYKGDARPTIINRLEDFNGVSREFVIVARADLEITDKTVDELTQYIEQTNVGIVGAKIVYGQKIQSLGLMVKNGFVPCYKNENVVSDGYMQNLNYAHSVTAVGAEIFAIKKSLVEKLGGFEPNYNDSESVIDMCLKIRRAGYEVVVNPYAVSYGKADSIQLSKEFKNKWKEVLRADDAFMRKEIF